MSARVLVTLKRGVSFEHTISEAEHLVEPNTVARLWSVLETGAKTITRYNEDVVEMVTVYGEEEPA